MRFIKSGILVASAASLPGRAACSPEKDALPADPAAKGPIAAAVNGVAISQSTIIMVASQSAGAAKAAEAWVNGYLDSFTQWDYARKAFDKWSADFARRFGVLRSG